MNQCSCSTISILQGDSAEAYQRTNLEFVDYAEGGWRELWFCRGCHVYWEITWEGGGGFDYGNKVLKKLNHEQLKERWPSHGDQEE